MSYVPPSPMIFDFKGMLYVPESQIVFDFSPKVGKPLLIATAGLRSLNAEPSLVPSLGLPWLGVVEADKLLDLRWGLALEADAFNSSGWKIVPPKEIWARAIWSTASATDEGALTSWFDIPEKDIRGSIAWENNLRHVGIKLSLVYNPRPKWVDSSKKIPLTRVDELGVRYDEVAVMVASLYQPKALPLIFSFGSQRYNPEKEGPVYFDFKYTPAKQLSQPVDGNPDRIRWGIARTIERRVTIPWQWARPVDPRTTGITYPDYDGPVVDPDEPVKPEEPELQDAYMIGNMVTVTERITGTPLLAQNIQLGYDADSFSWSLSMDVLGQDSMNLIRPDRNGIKQVVIDINGHTWVMLVERYRRSFKFPTTAYTITGASRTQLLTAPYATPISGVNSVDINARQVMDDLLLNTGFSINWKTLGSNVVPDWSITADAMSYQNQTPLQLIAKLSDAVGAITSPSLTTDVINIIPRYPYPVWQWEASKCSKILPAAIITNLGGEWTPNPAWDSCYVSGTNHGCSVLATRTGKAGVMPAEDVYEDVLTDQVANQYRAMVEISKGGDQELVTLQMPLFHITDTNAPGLVTPGMLCDVREVGLEWVGVCLSTNIACSGTGSSMVTQTLSLERHTEEI